MKMVRLSTQAVSVLALILVMDIGAICARPTSIEGTQEETEMLVQSDDVAALTNGHARQLKCAPCLGALFVGEWSHAHLLVSGDGQGC